MNLNKPVTESYATLPALPETAETVGAAFTGSEPAISFNPGYLLDGLAAAAVCGAGRPAPPGEAGGTESEPGRIQLEFTSPAKPALITWAGYDTAPMDEAGLADGAQDAVDGPPDAGDDSAPAFRYLVVPLRSSSST